MPSSVNPKTIVLRGQPIRKEGLAGDVIVPGMLLGFDGSGDLIPHGVAGGNAAPAFADVSDFLGRTIDRPHFPEDELNDRPADQVLYVVAAPGDEIYAFLAVGQNVAKGAFLESDGNGALRAFSNQANQFAAIVCRALEAANNSAGRAAARIRVEVM